MFSTLAGFLLDKISYSESHLDFLLHTGKLDGEDRYNAALRIPGASDRHSSDTMNAGFYLQKNLFGIHFPDDIASGVCTYTHEVSNEFETMRKCCESEQICQPEIGS